MVQLLTVQLCPASLGLKISLENPELLAEYCDYRSYICDHERGLLRLSII